ncbi:hypothetical protein ES044_06020, partial [Polaribacter sp. IC066]|uniref:reprolysin-like metallopeptidase n=2 Tax=unclassified Polaribacter TaxID=196858 RepID=UPI0011C32757
MHLKIKSTLLLLALPLVMLSQNGNYWSKTSAKSIAQKDVIQYLSKAENPVYYNLDKASLATYLANAPDRFEASSSAVVLTIPNPGGGMDRFEIFSTQTMAEGLAQNHLTVKSYVGRNVVNKSHTLRITLTTQGFYGMTLGSTYGQTLINPRVKDTNMYMVFSSKEAINTRNSFKCEVEEVGNTFESKSTFESQKFINGEILRRYRLAMATTVEYSNYHWLAAGLTASDTDTAKKNAVLIAIMVKVDRLNQIFERDLGITLQLIANNDLLISLGDTANDGYTNGNHSASINENQTITNTKVGAASYDVGHLLSTLGGGLAQVSAVCGSGKARAVTGSPAPVGDNFTISILAHEFGHQFGARHTQSSNVNENRATAVEPGSGSTIMSYAGVAAPNVQNRSDAMFHFTSISEISARFGFTNTGSCAEQITIANAAPVLTAVPNYTIPVNTPFKLDVTATDANGDALTYSWDQIDNEIVPNVPMPPESTSTAGPSFRSFLPTTNSARYFPGLSTLVTNVYASTWEVLPTVSRTLNFGVIVRDNNALGGQVSNTTTTLTVDNTAGPFRVTSQAGAAIIWGVGDTETITWDVANTDNAAGVNSQNVDILISTNGGQTFNTVLVSNTPNDGSANIVVPNNLTANARIMIIAADNVFFDINEAAIEITATPPSCINAQNIDVDNILADAAVLSWTGSQSNPSNGYDYIVNTTGTTPTASAMPTATLAQGATTVTPNGLAANTTYYFYIRANCGGGDLSDWSTAVSFKTTCTVLTAPFIQNFDGASWVNNGSIDPCWRRNPEIFVSNFTWGPRRGRALQNHATGPTRDVTDEQNGGTVGKYIYAEALGNNTFQNGDVAILSTPPIDLTGLAVPRMKFSYHMFGFTMGTMKVEIKEINAITYTTLFSISGQQQTTSAAPFIEQIIDLNAYAGQSVHIRFISIRGEDWGSTVAFDQFVIEETTGCANPENLMVSNLAVNSADLSWGTIGTAVNGYEWAVMADGVAVNPANAVATGTVAAGTTTTQVTGLNSSTTYDGYVRSNCGAAGLSSWSLVTKFRTICGVITAPFTENFDGAQWTSGSGGSSNTGDAIDSCWSRNPANASEFQWSVRAGATGSRDTGPSNDVTGGGKYVYTESSNPSGTTISTGDVATISTPAINLSALAVPRMKISYHMYGASMGTFRVDVKEISASTYTTVFTKSGQEQTASTNSFTEQTIDLSAFAGKSVHIRFIGIRGNSFNSDIAIDQFIVEETPGCFAPSGLSVANISATTADLSWNARTTAINGYEWVVMADDVAPNITTAIATGTSAMGTLTAQAAGLSGSTNYDTYIRTNCGSGVLSSWSSVFNFTSAATFITWTGAINNNWTTTGNWNTSVAPLLDDNIVIPSTAARQPVIGASSGVSLNNLNIANGASLNITSGGSLIVKGTSTGNITYNLAIPDNNWHLVSSPVVGEQYNNAWVTDNLITISANANRGISTYDNSVTLASGRWKYFKGGTTETFNTGIGYSMLRNTAGNFSFTGSFPTTNEISPAISQNDNSWNLLGNPYPSYIDIAKFIDANTLKIAPA